MAAKSRARVPAKPKLSGRTTARTTPSAASRPLGEQVRSALASLKKLSTKKDRDNLARFNIATDKAFGVSMSNVQKVAKGLGRNHELALALWETGWYEARLLTAFVDEPARITPAQMDRSAREFDNWALCDTLSFKLWDQTPHAWAKVKAWSGKREEFVKRTAFALLWSLTVHDKGAGNEQFVRGLALIEHAATDERHFVKKAVNMALRAVGKRNAVLHAAATAVARRLATFPESGARWIGTDALRELTSPAVVARLKARRTPR